MVSWKGLSVKDGCYYWGWRREPTQEASPILEALQVWGFSATHCRVLAVLARKCFLLLDF